MWFQTKGNGAWIWDFCGPWGSEASGSAACSAIKPGIIGAISQQTFWVTLPRNSKGPVLGTENSQSRAKATGGFSRWSNRRLQQVEQQEASAGGATGGFSRWSQKCYINNSNVTKHGFSSTLQSSDEVPPHQHQVFKSVFSSQNKSTHTHTHTYIYMNDSIPGVLTVVRSARKCETALKCEWSESERGHVEGATGQRQESESQLLAVKTETQHLSK